MAWGSRREMVGSATTAEAKMRRDRMLTILMTLIGNKEYYIYHFFVCSKNSR